MPYKDPEIAKQYSKEYAKKNIEKRRVHQKKYVKNNLEKVKASQKFYRDNNKEKIKEYNLKWWQENKQRLVAVKYKLTLEQYRQMIANSDGICAICGLEMTFDAKCQSQACVDHDHNTGKIRELICSRCNLMIGKAEDSIDILNKAILYLKKHKDCP